MCRYERRPRKRLVLDDESDGEGDNIVRRKAMSLQWLFYCPGDKTHFKLGYNHSKWPAHMSTLEKLCMQPNTPLSFEHRDTIYECKLVMFGTPSEVRAAQQKSDEKISQTEKTLTEIILEETFEAEQGEDVEAQQVQLPPVEMPCPVRRSSAFQSPLDLAKTPCATSSVRMIPSTDRTLSTSTRRYMRIE